MILTIIGTGPQLRAKVTGLLMGLKVISHRKRGWTDNIYP